MRALILLPQHNSHGKNDVTGAFKPEAFHFAKALTADGWDCTIHAFDHSASKAARRKQVESVIWEQGACGLWDLVAFFCHGYTTGMQTGHDLATVDSLAECIALRSSDTVLVPLYACDTAGTRVRKAAGGDGGFADALRDALSVRGKHGHVDAHTTTAHTTKNPHVRRFWMDGEARGTGGDWLVAPGSPKWSSWCKALRGPMRFRFPLLTAAEIDAAL